MKIIAQTAALQEALNLASNIVATRTPKPILQCVKLVAEGGVLTVLATDLEAGGRFHISAVQIDEEGEALVPADRLMGIVRESGDDSLTLQTQKDALVIKGKGSHFRIFGYEAAEYPAIAEFTEEGDFQIAASELKGMIDKTLFATAKAHSHYAISGVLWEASGKKLTLVATDGHRLALSRGQLSKPAGRDTTTIVPGKLMGLIQRIAGSGEEMLDVKVQENQILIRSARATIASSLVQGNFPKYGDLINREFNRKATLNVGQFEHRIRQAALLTNQESRGVRLSFSAEAVKLTSRAPESGEAELECPATLDGESMDIAFNPTFLLDALKVTAIDTVTLEMSASNKPAILRAGADFLYVLMPVDLT